MSEFNLNSEEVKNAIEKMNTLLEECKECYDKKVPKSDYDKGNTHNELKAVCKVIKKSFEEMGYLISNTIEFLGGSCEMFETSDAQQAAEISGA